VSKVGTSAVGRMFEHRNFSRNPRSRISLYTVQSSKSQCLVNCGESFNTKLPAVCRKIACNSAGLRPVNKLVIFLQGCRARLPAGLRPVIKLVIFLQGCRARLPGKAAGQGCRARLPGKAVSTSNVGKNATKKPFSRIKNGLLFTSTKVDCC
jgi:hypothetical protein